MLGRWGATSAAVILVLAATGLAWSLVGAARAPEPEGTLVCAGDVMLGRGVARLCRERGEDYPFALVAGYLQSADLAFGNLECSLTDLSTRFPRVNALRGYPQMAPALARAGFDVLSVANNHSIDYGRRGLAHTRELLAAAGIAPVGAGATQAEAEQGVVVTARGLRVGFLAYSRFPYLEFVRDPQRETVLGLDEETLRRTVPALARRCDVVVVSCHWGTEGVPTPDPEERALAHLAVDLGADLVVGHHSHVRGEVEQYRGALIAYGLGNLVFDESRGGNEGYLLTCRLGRRGVQGYELLPVRVVQGQATPEALPQ